MKPEQLVKWITIVCHLALLSMTVRAAVYYVDAVAWDGDRSKGAPYHTSPAWLFKAGLAG
jgi:hypothetical protein